MYNITHFRCKQNLIKANLHGLNTSLVAPDLTDALVSLSTGTFVTHIHTQFTQL